MLESFIAIGSQDDLTSIELIICVRRHFDWANHDTSEFETIDHE